MVLVTLAALLGAACSSASEPAPSGAPAPASPALSSVTTQQPSERPASQSAPTAPAGERSPAGATAPSPVPAIPVGTRVGQRIPQFTATTLDGAKLTNADLKDKPYLLFFFASW